MKMEDTNVSYKDSVFSELINSIPNNQRYFENYIAFLIRTKKNKKAKEIFMNLSNNFTKINPKLVEAINEIQDENKD